MHLLTGVRPENAFLVNHVVFFTLLVLVFVLVTEATGMFWGLLSVALVAAQPIIGISATGGGYDLLAATLLLAAIGMTLKRDALSDPDRAGLYLAMLLALTWTRYESVLYAGILFTVAFPALRRAFRSSRELVIWGAGMGLLLLPLALQQYLARNSHENPTGVSLFSLGHLLDNLRDAGTVLGTPDGIYPYLVPVFWIGLGAAAWALRRRSAWISVWTPVVLAWSVVNFSHLGSLPGHPASARFFIFPTLLLTLAAVFGAARLRVSPRMLKPVCVILGLPLIVWGHSMSVELKHTNTLTLVRETADALAFLRPWRNTEVLVIAERPGQYTVNGFGAVNFDWARANLKQIQDEFDRHLFTEVFVLQRMVYGMSRPVPETDLPDSLRLEIAKEIQITGMEVLRISRLTRQKSAR
jgi:hypothetical protein